MLSLEVIIMDVASLGDIFISSLYLYFAAAIVSLILSQSNRLCSFISQGLCIVSAVIGMVSSVYFLFSGMQPFSFEILPSTIPNIAYTITIDELSSFFILSLSILVFCVSIYTIGYVSHYEGKHSIPLFHCLYAIFALTMFLVFTADNGIMFFLSWELMTIVSYFLVIYEKEKEETRNAGLLYIVMTHICGAFLMAAFMLMYYYTGSFSFDALSETIPNNIKQVLFLFFFIAFSAKGGLIPLHIWLPHAHPAAPSNVSALMSGIMIKAAVYGILRFVFLYLGATSLWWGVLLLILGLCSALIGVLYAYIEQNIKRLLAYSSIENMGIIFMGLGIAIISYAQGFTLVGTLALTGTLFHCFNHTFFKGGLFLGAGAIDFATHTKDMESLGGLIKTMPKTAVIIFIPVLAISAVVPLNGFVGEWILYQSLFAGINASDSVFRIIFMITVAALAFAGALAAACFIKLFGIAFLGNPRTSHSINAKEVPFSMQFGSAILSFLCILFGLFPLLGLSFIGKVIAPYYDSELLSSVHGNRIPMFEGITLTQNHTSISPGLVLILVMAITILVMLFFILTNSNRKARLFGTWDCGFAELTPKMQYSGIAFSKPIQIVFKLLFKFSRDFKQYGDSPYHPKTMEYTITTESVFEKYFYVPLLYFVTKISEKFKFTVQTGSIHTYLLYIFLTVLLLMCYNRIFG